MPTAQFFIRAATSSPGRLRNLFAALLCRALAIIALAPAAHAQTVTESTLYNFTGGTDSMGPGAALIQGGDGQLYGTALGNFFPDYGEVFRISLAGALTPLYRFSGGADSATPAAAVVLGGDGNLYGTTYGNFLAGTQGTVFKLATGGGALTTLFNFSGGANGGNPVAGLVQGSDGSLFGAAGGGGVGYGTLFKITSSGALTTLTTLTNSNGALPFSPPIEGSDGNFYGVTEYGGVSNFGTVYQLTPAGVLTTIYSFRGAGDGATPSGPLVEGPDGNFYGATQGNASVSAANGGSGTIFMITPAGTLTTLHSFTASTDGESPSGLFLASDGNLYGDAGLGGASNTGTIFRVAPTGSFTTLYSFAATGDGARPQGALIQADDGDFYGTTSGGGTSLDGTVFRLTLSPAPVAPVQLTSSGASIPLGSQLTLSWQVLNAFSKTFRNCYASVTPSVDAAGAWTGQQGGTYDATTQIYSGSAAFTPTLPGTYIYGLTCGGVESGTATVTVGNATSLLITTSSLPTASVGAAYSAVVGAIGGVQPYTFSITAGSLPGGLTLNKSTGVISGTPTQAGTSNFTVRVQDSDPVAPATASVNLGMKVVVPLVITNTGFPAGRVGTAYSQTLTASGGTPPYVWSLSSVSALPNGLLLSPQGVISGTPTTAGTTSFIVNVSDSASQLVSDTFNIAIYPLLDSTGTITLTPASIPVGQTTVAAVSIAAPPGSPAPTGSVQFQSNGVNLGSPVPLIGGTASLTTGAFTATGNFAISATYTGDANYLLESYESANLAVTVAPVPAIGITPSSVSVAPGSTASLTVTVLNFSSQSISFSCTNLPANVSCSFGALSSTGTATLSIETAATAALPVPLPPGGPANSPMLAFIVPTLMRFGGPARRHSRVARLKRVLPWVVSLLVAAVMTACGGSDVNYAGAGTNTITVTATAGSQTASTQITLVVS